MNTGTKKAFFVTGPEGSGTMMMTRALTSAGVTEVFRGIRSYNTNYAHLISPLPDLIWMHRSLPSAGIWPNLTYAEYAFADVHNYETFGIFMTRELNATRQSQERRGAVFINYNIQRAYKEASESLRNFFPVSYEAFISSEGFRRWLFTLFGLPMPTIKVRDENAKYYE